MPLLSPLHQREFAREVLQRLRVAGYDAYWAGGCVRDHLMRRTPKDYDVATNALPDQVRDLFGRRRTVPVGAAFGVIMVVGPTGAGQVEVTTFRRDAAYSDGRHPDSVTFSSAEEDASRRDFTINGLFYDPVEDRVLDYVGGQADLAQGIIRAIGDPAERFAEDKLRMLRAVRFAATFDFHLDEATWTAIQRTADQISVVSPERIAAEMRRLLVETYRVRGLRLLVQARLAETVLPEILASEAAAKQGLERNLAVLGELRAPRFPSALAVLLSGLVDAGGAQSVGLRWRLSNKEIESLVWLVDHHQALRGARRQPRCRLFRVLAHADAANLSAMTSAAARAGQADPADAAWCLELLEGPREKFDPNPLLTGGDLLQRGWKAGPAFRHVLEAIRDAQLEGEIGSRDEALALAERLYTSFGENHARRAD